MTVVLESLTARNFDSFCAPLVAVVAVVVPPYQFADTFVHHYHYHYPFYSGEVGVFFAQDHDVKVQNFHCDSFCVHLVEAVVNYLGLDPLAHYSFRDGYVEILGHSCFFYLFGNVCRVAPSLYCFSHRRAHVLDDDNSVAGWENSEHGYHFPLFSVCFYFH